MSSQAKETGVRAGCVTAAGKCDVWVEVASALGVRVPTAGATGLAAGWGERQVFSAFVVYAVHI